MASPRRCHYCWILKDDSDYSKERLEEMYFTPKEGNKHIYNGSEQMPGINWGPL